MTTSSTMPSSTCNTVGKAADSLHRSFKVECKKFAGLTCPYRTAVARVQEKSGRVLFSFCFNK